MWIDFHDYDDALLNLPNSRMGTPFLFLALDLTNALYPSQWVCFS
jgi:hypothetical protein